MPNKQVVIYQNVVDIDAPADPIDLSSMGGGGPVSWGTIIGTLASQTDLNTALAGKEPVGGGAAAVAAHAQAADPHTGYQRESEKGAANGYAGLDANSRVPMAQIASGTPTGALFVRDDGTLAAPAGGAAPAGVLADLQLSALNADFTLAAAAGVQSAFPAAQDVFTLAAAMMYRVRGQLIVNTGATTHTTALAWALGGGATIASFEYLALVWTGTANQVQTAQSAVHVSGVASKVLNATSAAVWTLIQFEGLLRTTLGGTITPQINFSANPTGTNLMKRGSYISFERLGANTLTVAGGWA